MHRDARGDRRPEAGGGGDFGAVGGIAGKAFREALRVVAFFRGEAPEGEVRSGQRGELAYFLDREAEAVVAAGADGHRDADRDVQRRHDEGEERRLFAVRFEVEDRRRAEQVVGFARVVGVDRDQPGLRVRRALVEGVVGGGAVGDRVGVAEDPLRSFEDDVARRLGRPGVGERERGREIGVPAGGGVGGGGGEGFDRLFGLRRGGERGQHRQRQAEEEGDAQNAVQGLGHFLPP